ncbi:glycosyltransferase family 39 protein [Altererythrobacter lutimaris]|uniref:Glycosyltransferase RgtA/B/C/D-like domain-containing protein n=1 Tax=Altererythrobacter lutimaris TaxID=2743979 RepID=A0A850H7Y9_9SPHN|nr:hypothetical protein [Altererythrobacter lutimaris]
MMEMQANQFETEADRPLNNGAGLSLSRAGWLALGLVVIAAVLRLVGLSSREIHPDEWYHVLAGASWAEGEGLTFIRGIYDRAWPFTISTAWAHSWLGLDGFIAARFPALVAGVVCVWLIYILGKRTASPAVGLIAAALLTVDNMAIEWSQISRFYTMQTACILGIACIFAGPSFGAPRANLIRTAIAAVAALALAVLALLLQVISILGIAGLILFLFTRTPYFSLEFARTSSPERTLVGTALVIGAVIGLAGASMMWPELRATQAWSAQDANNFLYYDDYLRAMYGVLWPLTPLAVLIGLSHSRKAVLLALSVIVPVLLVQSIGGMKAPRYIMQCVPFIILLWAVGLRSGFLWLAGMIRDRVPFGNAGPGHWVSNGAALAVLAFALAGNLSFRESAKWAIRDGSATLAGKPIFSGEPLDPAMQAASQEAATKLRIGESVLIASDPWIQAYYGQAGQFMLINPLNDDDQPLNYERKTGQVRIGNAEELAIALDCLPSADILLQSKKAGTFYLPPETMAVIETRAKPVAMDHSALRLYQWDRPVDQTDTDCTIVEAELAKQS